MKIEVFRLLVVTTRTYTVIPYQNEKNIVPKYSKKAVTTVMRNVLVLHEKDDLLGL